jgi:hypothetical protein
MLQGNFMIITNCRKLSPICHNSPHFAAICRNSPQFTAKRCNLPQLTDKRLQRFLGFTLCPFLLRLKKIGDQNGGQQFHWPHPPTKKELFLVSSSPLP